MERISIPRRLVQTAFFIVSGQWLLMGFLRCPFGVPFVSCATCPLGDCSGRFLFFPFLLLMIGVTALFGRAFCGWICPMGYLQDVLAFFSPKALAHSPAFAAADRRRRWGKWLMLGLTIIAVVQWNLPAERAHPYVVRADSLWNWEAWLIAGSLGAKRYAVRWSLLLVALAGGLLVGRFWCRYLCPLGALLGLSHRGSLCRLERDRDACVDCGAYPRNCPQGTVPETSECVVCGDCVQGCKQSAIHLAFRRRKTARKEDADS
ncbi:MAG: 4Fe-4S binding protein [Lentisphaeria bacterium]|nr:4Fe-4S binding protein [Lentisphaeria bacterium]